MPESISITRITLGTVVKKSVRTVKNKDDLSERAVKKPRKQKSEKYLKYQRYIRSKEFKKVREMVLERDGHCCQFCGRTVEDGATLTVHHRCYRHLYEGGELEAADCITICSCDHLALHRVKRNYAWFSIDNERNTNAVEEEENE